MTLEEIRWKKNGIYRVFWREGGVTVAANGCMSDGAPWLASTNWLGPIGALSTEHAGRIREMDLLLTQNSEMARKDVASRAAAVFG